MRYAVVDNSTGNVVNAILQAEGDTWQPPEGTSLVPSDAAGTGWTYSLASETFTPPATTVHALSAVEARDAALLADTNRIAFVALLRSFNTGADVQTYWAGLTASQKANFGLQVLLLLARNAA